MKTLIINKPFPLELEGELPAITIAYQTWGELNAEKNNVIWICHALTADSDAASWWPRIIGKGKLFDPDRHFIVCANILGSCYGTTGPLSVNPETGRPWYRSFPRITVRDMVAAHELLRQYLGIVNINTLTGGSLGGFQAMEWAISNSRLFRNLVLLATSASLSPWAIAFNQSQRLAIEADATFHEGWPGGGLSGLKAARAIALLSYRNGQIYNQTQKENDTERTTLFRAATYQDHQGEKLVKRFNAYSYHLLTRAMDSHNVGRGRGGIEAALGKIRARTLAISISSDILFSDGEMKILATHIPDCTHVEITSAYGHDGFLTETEKISQKINQFNLKEKYESAS